MQTNEHSTFPPEVQEGGSRIHHIVEAAMHAALTDLVVKHNNRDRTSALYTALMAMAGPLSFIARLIAEPKDGEDNTIEICDKELPLVAGLIAGRICQLEKDGIKMDFNGRNVLAAVEAASKVAGYDVKPLINKHMMQSYQEGSDRDGRHTLGYWDYLPEVTPTFDEFSEKLTNYTNFSRSKH